MRAIVLVVTLLCAVSCGGPKLVRQGQQEPPVASARSVEQDRAADEAAYRFVYVPAQSSYQSAHRGEWLAVVGGRVVPASGAVPAPVATMAEADAAARAAVPEATHRFIFQIGEEGDVVWQMGGCELKHVVGNQFLALLEEKGADAKSLGPGGHMNVTVGGTSMELTVPTSDAARMYVRPQVGPPGAGGTAKENFCVSSGFEGSATMTALTGAGLELWEIPGVVRITGAVQSGDCRRARARMAWPGTPLDLVVPVAVWPK